MKAINLCQEGDFIYNFIWVFFLCGAMRSLPTTDL